jgi:hypothetical protein
MIHAAGAPFVELTRDDLLRDVRHATISIIGLNARVRHDGRPLHDDTTSPTTGPGLLMLLDAQRAPPLSGSGRVALLAKIGIRLAMPSAGRCSRWPVGFVR